MHIVLFVPIFVHIVQNLIINWSYTDGFQF